MGDILAAALAGLARVEVFVYAALGLAAAWFIFSIYRSGQRLEDTPFGIERAEAEQARMGAVVGLVVLAALAWGVFWLVNSGSGALSDVIRPTTTAAPRLTPTAITASGQVQVDKTGCNDVLAILKPVDGELINTTYELLGTVNPPNLAFYKLELSGAATDGNWVTIGVGLTPVEGGPLLRQSFSPNPYTPGYYALRVTAYDNDGEPSEPCVVSIQLDQPGQPTPPPVP